MSEGKLEIFTIGHSNRKRREFLRLVRSHEIDVVADVRSVPRSGFAPLFDRERLEASLRRLRTRYVFLGEELGGRPRDAGLYREVPKKKGARQGRAVRRVVDYEKVAESEAFRRGLERVVEGARRGHRIALLCVERDPLDCHRALLVGEALHERGVRVVHIIKWGEDEEHERTRSRAAREASRGKFDDPRLPARIRDAAIERALAERARKVAYKESIEADREIGATEDRLL